MMIKKKPEIIPLPFPYYGFPVILLSIAGLADSAYLALSHYRNYTDIGYASFCAISRAINCDTVSQSPYAIFLGVPVAIWGVWGYAFVLFLSFHGWYHKGSKLKGWNLFFLVSLAFCISSAILAAISNYFIHSYCIMCILTYGINLALLFYGWMIRKRFKAPPLVTGLAQDIAGIWQGRRSRIAILGLGAAVVAAIAFYPPYWHYSARADQQEIATGLTAEGYPWIGAPDPELEITEFTDYLCFQCRKMHYFLRNLVARYPNRIRLIHRNFPMDKDANPLVKEQFHAGAGKMALLAIFAEEHGRFWQMNDALFSAAAKGGDIDLAELAARVGIAKERLLEALTTTTGNRVKLAKDIRDGLRLKMTGTPTYVIDGKTYVGQIPGDILRPYLK